MTFVYLKHIIMLMKRCDRKCERSYSNRVSARYRLWSLTCLRLFALRHLVPAPLALLLVLIVSSSPPFDLNRGVQSRASSSFRGGILR